MIPALIENVDIIKVVRPKGDRLIILRDLAPERTDAGVEIGHLDLKPNTGVVLSVGPHVTAKLIPGATVMFSKNAGTEIVINKSKLLIMHEQDLWVDMTNATPDPFHDKVLIKLDAMPEIINGIIVPSTVTDTPKVGNVVAVGPECVETKPGDRVLIGSFAGLQVGENLILREADLFASL